MSILIFFVILLVLVLVHEAGHFFAAKIVKMRVDEFAFGFPPRLFSIKKGETEYSFNALPLGGYVKIHGENGSDNQDDIERAFASKSKLAQIFVLIAGVSMNILLAVVLLSTTFFIGAEMAENDFTKPQYFSNQKIVVSSVGINSPAEVSGLSALDSIDSISAGEDYIEPKSPEDIISFIEAHQSSEITFVARSQDGSVKKISVLPKYDETLNKNIVGISTGLVGDYRAPLFESLKSGVLATFVFTKLTFFGFIDLIISIFKGQGSEAAASLTGPVGIVSLVGEAQESGVSTLIGFTALISINLAVLNILPLPALDGGRIVFVLYEAITRKKISLNVQSYINGISFLLLIALMIFVTYKDIIKL